MTVTEQTFHILALEIVGRARESAEDLDRSLAILEEIVTSMPAFEAAETQGDVKCDRTRGKLFLFFSGDQTAPVRVALELTDLFPELPSLSVRMAIHTGPIESGTGVVDGLLNGAASGDIALSASYAQALQSTGDWSNQIQADAETGRYLVQPKRLFLLGDAGPIRQSLHTALAADGHEVEDDRDRAGMIAWAKSLEDRIRAADTIVALVSRESVDDELVKFQLEVAADERRKRGFPQIVPVWLQDGPKPDEPLGILQRNLHQATLSDPNDEARVLGEVRSFVAAGQVEIDETLLETSGGAVSTDSRFYIRRTADGELENALRRNESIILLKGPRQIGKTSLIGHGIDIAKELGLRTAHTDFQKLSSRQLDSEESFCRVIATTLAKQLGVPFDFDTEWFEPLGGNLNLDGFVRAFIEASPTPLVWFIDEADRLFTSPFASDFFALVRSWHNSRATERGGPWNRLTVVIGYATEAYLFIRDLNQSPFNVGRPIDIPMFSLENVLDLNDRYGRPIAQSEDVARLYELLDGQPFLTRRAFDLLVTRGMTFEELMEKAPTTEGPFGDHLERLLVSVTQLPDVWDALLHSLSDPSVPESEGTHRLVAAGILVRGSGKRLNLRCELYRRFLAHYVQK